MTDKQPEYIRTITEFHRLRGLPGPVHPLVSVVRFEDMRSVADHPASWVLDLYAIALKRNFRARLKYGQGISTNTNPAVFTLPKGGSLV